MVKAGAKVEGAGAGGVEGVGAGGVEGAGVGGVEWVIGPGAGGVVAGAGGVENKAGVLPAKGQDSAFTSALAAASTLKQYSCSLGPPSLV